MTPPATRPPPRTRSNSSMPVGERGLVTASTLASERTTLPAPASAWNREAGLAAIVSTSVFQAPQLRALPLPFAGLPAAFGAGVSGLGLGHGHIMRRVMMPWRLSVTVDHCDSSSGCTTAVPSLPTTMPAARLAMRTALERSARAPSERADRSDDRVAGAGYVIDLARLSGNVLHAGIGVQRHALFRARDEQRVEGELVRKLGLFASSASLRQGRRLAEFGPIRGEHRCAAIAQVSLRLSDRPVRRAAGRAHSIMRSMCASPPLP